MYVVFERARKMIQLRAMGNIKWKALKTIILLIK